MGKRIFKTLTLLILILLASCAKKPELKAERLEFFRPFHRITKTIYRGETLIYPGDLPPFEGFPSTARLYGGTISHHDLTWVFLDQWFRILKSRMDVKCFVIIALDHFDQSREYLALSSRNWVTSVGELQADRELAEKIKEVYNIEEEPEVFDSEHAIREIIPYIIEYFPQSRVLPIIQKEHLFRTSKLEKLITLLQKQLQEDPSYFVITSVDFSHYKNREQTREQDEYAAYYLQNQWKKRLRFPVCDNMAGLYVLNQLMDKREKPPKISILAHSNSFQITGKEPDNVTSYFFSFYWLDEGLGLTDSLSKADVENSR